MNKFIADAMLGKLVRWLRFSGYDVEYSNKCSDEDLIKKAVESDRILLTRDIELFKRSKRMGTNSILVESGDIIEQLVQLGRIFNIKILDNPEKSLCPMCNGKIKRIDKEKVENMVPEGVFKNISDFYQCSSCSKIYWEGTHWENIKRIVQKIDDNVQDSKRRGNN